MYKAFILILLCLQSIFLNAQNQLGPNLVYNGGFEILDSCPTGISGWYIGYRNLFPNWQSPNSNTPDNFHRCAPLYAPSGVLGASVPINFWGDQEPNSGDGYGGFAIITYCCGADYLQSRLIEPLIPGRKYCIEFYLSRGEYVSFAVNKIGVLFTTDSLIARNTGPFQNFNPQFTTGSRIISKADEWEYFHGEFIADSNYNWLTIGRFNIPSSDEFTDLNDSNPSQHGTAYYYIDDIWLSECEGYVIPNIFTPNGDGINDNFELTSGACPELIQIYNRWGKLIYQTSDSCFWDGKINEVECPSGNYYYLLNINNKIYKGFVQLIR